MSTVQLKFWFKTSDQLIIMNFGIELIWFGDIIAKVYKVTCSEMFDKNWKTDISRS